MTRLGSQLRAFFEETSEPLTIEEVLARRTVVVGEEPTGGDVGHPPWWSGPRLAVAVGALAMVLFVAVASLLAGPDLEVGGVDSAEAAAVAITQLHKALAERDSSVVEAFFGEDVVLYSYLGLEFESQAAADYLMTISVPMTIEDVSEPVEGEDGWIEVEVVALAETHRYPELWRYRVLMDGTTVVEVDLAAIDALVP